MRSSCAAHDKIINCFHEGAFSLGINSNDSYCHFTARTSSHALNLSMKFSRFPSYLKKNCMTFQRHLILWQNWKLLHTNVNPFEIYGKFLKLQAVYMSSTSRLFCSGCKWLASEVQACADSKLSRFGFNIDTTVLKTCLSFKVAQQKFILCFLNSPFLLLLSPYFFFRWALTRLLIFGGKRF